MKEILDLDLPTVPFPAGEDPLMPPAMWDEWLKHERLRLVREGKINSDEIPEWKGEPFVWKD